MPGFGVLKSEHFDLNLRTVKRTLGLVKRTGIMITYALIFFWSWLVLFCLDYKSEATCESRILGVC